MSQEQPCPICTTPCPQTFAGPEVGYTIRCPRCGDFYLDTDAGLSFNRTFLQMQEAEALVVRSVASHVIRRMTRAANRYPQVTRAVYEDVLRRQMPSPQEQADNLIQWLGTLLVSTPERVVTFPTPLVAATIGTADEPARTDGLAYVASHLRDQKLISCSITGPGSSPLFMAQMTFGGWARYTELQHEVTRSRTAFMAMQYNDPQLDDVYRSCFSAAVGRAGFKLRRLDEYPEAGLIDNRLRAEIRSAAFLIADLTHRNAGAYWEAGFAEGLEKPVIYTCSKDVFDDPKSRPHFDVNHHTTIIWHPDHLQKATDELTATIRNTLPSEAKMENG